VRRETRERPRGNEQSDKGQTDALMMMLKFKPALGGYTGPVEEKRKGGWPCLPTYLPTYFSSHGM